MVRSIEMRASNEEIRDQMLKIADGIEKEIERIEDVSQWLEGVLEVRRVQSIVDGKWETVKYELLLTYGGPTVRVWTDGTIRITWGFDYLEGLLSEEAIEKLKEVEEYLDSLESE